MLPGDMNLKIRSETVGYNNKILVSDGKFSLGKNENINLTLFDMGGGRAMMAPKMFLTTVPKRFRGGS